MTAGANVYPEPPLVTLIVPTVPALSVAAAVAVTIGLGITAGLLLVAVIVNDVGGLFEPSLMPVSDTVCCPGLSGSTGGLGLIGFSVGGWLTGVTVMLNVSLNVFLPPLAVPPLSITVTVISAVPLALATGV